MKRLGLATLAAILLAAPARAQFEGVVEMKMTAQGGSATMKAFVSKAGSRSEIEAAAQNMPVKMTTLVRFDHPDSVYMINDARKSYTEIDLTKMRNMAGGAKEHKFTVKKLGTETVAGYSCTHVLVTDDEGNESEMWTTKDIASSGALWESMKRSAKTSGKQFQALKDAGADGFPVKMVVHGKGGAGAATIELVKAEKRSLPASLFEVPAGYTKEEGLMGAASAVQLPPEVQKMMEERMKNMTPEQREMMEKMMKERAQAPAEK